MPAGVSQWWPDWTSLFAWVGTFLYIAFFLVVHLMKLHCLSLVWGVTTEAMEYEEVARRRTKLGTTKTRLERLALVGFGGTLGGILGSGLASSMAQLLRLPGLLLVAAFLLEVSAELSIELGRIMQKHWTEQQLFQSQNDLHSLDASMKKSASVGSMKRIASGNSLNRVKSATELSHPTLSGNGVKTDGKPAANETLNDDTFFQRLLRGVTTILRSRLLMAIFTYNALYASTTVLLSFQRAALIADRNDSSSAEADTAFHRALAKATRNTLLIWLIGQINTVRSLDEWTRMRHLTLDEQIIRNYNTQHREVLNALRSREPERAAVKMKEHLETARMSLMRAAEA